MSTGPASNGRSRPSGGFSTAVNHHHFGAEAVKNYQPGRLFAFVSRYPWAILVVALVLSALSLWYARSAMTFLTGRDSLMPGSAPFQREYSAYRQEFGDQEEIVVVIESGDATQS